MGKQQDCILTLSNQQSRIITSSDIHNIHSNIIVTTHPDCTIRLWDVNTKDTVLSFNDNKNNICTNTIFKPSHKSYVSNVKWSTKNPFLFVSSSYDGTCKLWDIRCNTIPLSTFNVCCDGGNGKEKALCIEFGYCNENKHEIFSSGLIVLLNNFCFNF